MKYKRKLCPVCPDGLMKIKKDKDGFYYYCTTCCSTLHRGVAVIVTPGVKTPPCLKFK